MPFEASPLAQSTAVINPGPGWPLISAQEFILEMAVDEGLSKAAIDESLQVTSNRAICFLEARNLTFKPLSSLEQRDFVLGVFWLALSELVPRFPRFFGRKGPGQVNTSESDEAELYYQDKGRDRLKRIAGYDEAPVIGVHSLAPKPSPRDRYV